MRDNDLEGGPLRLRRLLPLALALLLVPAGAWVALEHGNADGPLTTEHPTPVPDTVRTVTVSATMPTPSSHDQHLSAMLEEGRMPSRPTVAEVLTDTECTPDPRMISRCRNEVRLADGRTVVLRHPHDMRTIPCLAPGEHVLLVPASA
ncbi:MAG TPA: hypothetical protein VI503_01975 [Gaiellaceae bacterium]|nr:hypothetical protein [Gaiellaceae bacterium]